MEFHPDEIEVLRRLPPRQAFERVKDALYRSGHVRSDEFVDAYEQLVELGVLTQEQLEEFLA
ncbi:MAG TPA: hypothetical protein VFO11_02390 [Candidatus Polarisedimenticolaceae bacterium]|nr:hypothetical protein [Candidatus Polarisedimenticolaceae bacterium]